MEVQVWVGSGWEGDERGGIAVGFSCVDGFCLHSSEEKRKVLGNQPCFSDF